MITHNDITDRKNAEEQLKLKNNELNTFVYKASHDLKGPLASIIGLSSATAADLEDFRWLAGTGKRASSHGQVYDPIPV